MNIIDNFHVNGGLIAAVTSSSAPFALGNGMCVRLCNEGAVLVRFVFGNAGATAISTTGAGNNGSPALMPGAAEVFGLEYDPSIQASGPTFVALKTDSGTANVSIHWGTGT